MLEILCRGTGSSNPSPSSSESAANLRVDLVIGIGAGNQISAGADSRQGSLAKAYDEFWTAAGGVRLERNMYHLPVPSSHRPVQSIKRNHRSRVMRKREYKKLVKQRVCVAFRTVALRNRWR